MTAEGLRRSLARSCGDGVSESKGVGGTAGWRNLCCSFVTRPCHGGGGRAVLLALGDRYRLELRRQNLHSWPCLGYWHQQLKAPLNLHLHVLLRHVLLESAGDCSPANTKPQIEHRCCSTQHALSVTRNKQQLIIRSERHHLHHLSTTKYLLL